MKFTVSSLELKNALDPLYPIAGPNNVLPVLECFLFDVRDTLPFEGDMKLTLTASSLDVTISKTMDVTVQEEGSIAIPAKMLMDTLKSLSDQEISIVADKSIRIITSSGEYRMDGYDPKDFPSIPSGDGNAVKLNSEALNRAIDVCKHVVKVDEMRLAISGVYCQISGDVFTMVSTDTHRLSKVEMSIDSDVQSDFILHKDSIGVLASLEGDVSLRSEGACVELINENTSIWIKKVDAKYPDHRRVIPAYNDNEIVFDKYDMLSALRRLMIYGDKNTTKVVLSINDDKIVMTSEDKDFNNSATESISCSSEASIVINFNGKFLYELCKSIDNDQVILNVSMPNKAAILYPITQKDDEDVLLLLMPLI